MESSVTEKDAQKEDAQIKKELKEADKQPQPIADLQNFFQFKPFQGSHLAIFAATHKGKTELIKCILEKYLPCWQLVIIMSGSYPYNKDYENLQKKHPQKVVLMRYTDDNLLKFIKTARERAVQGKMVYTLLVLEDFISQQKQKGKDLMSGFITDARHCGIDLCLSSQQANGVITPLIRENIAYFCWRGATQRSLKIIRESVLTGVDEEQSDMKELQKRLKNQDSEWNFIVFRKMGDSLDGFYRLKVNRPPDEKKEKKEQLKDQADSIRNNRKVDFLTDLAREEPSPRTVLVETKMPAQTEAPVKVGPALPAWTVFQRGVQKFLPDWDFD